MLLKKREPDVQAMWPFDDWFDDLLSARMPSLLRGTTGFVPTTDIYEEKEGLVVRSELPGMTEKDVNVELDGNSLLIRGEKREEHEEKNGGHRHRVESRYGSFARRIQLPASVDPDKADAKFKDGVLTIRFPYREEAKKRQIKIQSK